MANLVSQVQQLRGEGLPDSLINIPGIQIKWFDSNDFPNYSRTWRDLLHSEQERKKKEKKKRKEEKK
ncbi:MAG TPA: hypothetical protein EYQ71_06535, partial [Candidatus Thioglobus sp.]|nr:hypothetical protein [Candidatus Thioglobus sp.]